MESLDLRVAWCTGLIVGYFTLKAGFAYIVAWKHGWPNRNNGEYPP